MEYDTMEEEIEICKSAKRNRMEETLYQLTEDHLNNVNRTNE